MQSIQAKKNYAKAKNRSFNALMDLYEQNYLRLRRLLPDAESLGQTEISVVPNGLDLHYQLLEKCRYTDTFILTYKFFQDDKELLAPNLLIRWYRDAQLAEVVSGVLHKHAPRQLRVAQDSRISLVNHCADQHDLLLRWRLNRLLYKWLNFCLKQGHRIVHATTAQRVNKQLSSLYANQQL